MKKFVFFIWKNYLYIIIFNQKLKTTMKTNFEKQIQELLSKGITSYKLFDKNNKAYESGFATFLLENYEYINNDNYCRIFLTKRKANS